MFTPKYLNIPKLENYRAKVSDPEFWLKWPTNYNPVGKSNIDWEKLLNLAEEANLKDKETLNKVICDLRYGARIGCQGTFRKSSYSTNANSAYEQGPAVSDVIAEWLDKGFAYGPIPENMTPKNKKVSGIMTKVKPTGSVRIILNMSQPKGNSVNEGINNDNFPAKMSSTTKWV